MQRSCHWVFSIFALAVLGLVASPNAAAAAPQDEAGPVLVVETVKGTFEIQTFPEEAPETVAHIVALVNRNFYRGLRFHIAQKDFALEVGDPQTRNMTLKDRWGRGSGSGSGQPIGVAEFSKTLKHKRGSVGMSHAGNPNEADPEAAAMADSMFYIILARTAPGLDGKYTVWGEVTSGLDVLDEFQVGDIVRNITVKSE